MKKYFQFPATFWVANVMELFERLAWYGILIVLPLYLTGSVDDGAMGFSQAEKGYLMGIVGMIGYLLPVFTGTIADNWGFKKTLILSFLVLASGYYLMGVFHSYTGIFLSFLLVATGAALFKPIIAATVARVTNDGNASIGFGIFYMMVNIGSFVGPILAAMFKKLDWQYVFIIGSAAIMVNLILVILFYREPKRVHESPPFGKAMLNVLKNFAGLLLNYRYMIFLLIIAGFWTMYLQLFFSLANFVDQWFDTSSLYTFIERLSPWVAREFADPVSRTVPAELLVNADAMFIILFQVIVSTLVMKWKPLNSMITGMLVATIGITLAFMQQDVLFFFVSIFIFAIGEMAASPKITEYIGKLAPPEKVGFYIGTSFLPLGLGYFLAGLIAGEVYGKMADKVGILREALTARGVTVPELSSTFTSNDLYALGEQSFGMDKLELTNYLWETYDPWRFSFVLAAVGVFSVISLILYDRFVVKGQHRVE